jgi:hypothetical protein
LLALVFGYTARRQIRRTGESGDGLALAGIVLGWIPLALMVLGWLTLGAAFSGGTVIHLR